MKQLFLALFMQTGLVLTCMAQTAIPFDNPRWTISAKEAIADTFLGRKCLRIKEGTATLTDAHFTNGEIDFDMTITHARYFPGVGFRVRDTANGEIFYLRPHQSGNPDAMQYYPEFNGDGAWQLYYGEGFNHAQVLPFDRWIHVRILVNGSRAEVWFDKELVLHIQELLRPIQEGMIVLENPYPETTRYADFSYRSTDTVALQSPIVKRPPLPASMITEWKVSSPFDEALLKESLPDIQGLRWQDLSTDDRGMADLSRLAGTAKGRNTVLARLTIPSDKDTLRKVSFGFSDRVRVYLNGKLLYAGADEFMSRDYRFLGTVGFYDALYLPLKQGANDLTFAVSEDFGGWGVTAKVE